MGCLLPPSLLFLQPAPFTGFDLVRGKFNLDLSCGKNQLGLNRTEPKQTPVDSRCWSRDLPIPGQHSGLSDPPGIERAPSPATPSGAVCPAALCSSVGVSETLKALIDDTVVPLHL